MYVLCGCTGHEGGQTAGQIINRLEILPDMIQCGGELLNLLHQLMQKVWVEGKVVVV